MGKGSDVLHDNAFFSYHSSIKSLWFGRII